MDRDLIYVIYCYVLQVLAPTTVGIQKYVLEWKNRKIFLKMC